MATRVETQGGAHLLVWALGDGETGEPLSQAGAADRTAQISGTFAGATARLEGSNDNVAWFTLHDLAGAEVSTSVGLISVVAENPLYLRGVTVGGAGAAVNILVLARRP